MPLTYLLTHVHSPDPGATLPPSLSLALTPATIEQILRAQHAAQALNEEGEEVYGIDLVCGSISPSPLQIAGLGAVSPYRAGVLDAAPLAPGVGLLADLPPDEEAGDFWQTHTIDVRGLRVTETTVRLFAWSGAGRWRMESDRVDIGALIEMVHTRSDLN